MELKLLCQSAGFSGGSVLIAPLWNWNHMQWTHTVTSRCSNRTFMELKFIRWLGYSYYKIVLIAPLWNWNWIRCQRIPESHRSSNRTFMELKFIKYKLVARNIYVLIAPLWNWNAHRLSKTASSRESSNRTFMELKWWARERERLQLQRSNRTFMELKFAMFNVIYSKLWEF